MTPPPHTQSLDWNRLGWIEEVGAWIDAELYRFRLQLTAPIEQSHIRPWSTVLRVPTSAGALFFKATSPATGYEPALTQVLAVRQPECSPEVLAIEAERGWLLMRSSGDMLRTLIDGPEAAERHWSRALPRYAELQIELAELAPELLTLGVPDRRLAALTTAFEALLANDQPLRVGQPAGLTGSDLEQLRQLVQRVARQCAVVHAFGIPETLHHDDFHDGNVFNQDGRYIFADWAESAVAHPFFSLVVALRSIAYRAEVPADDPLISQLRDCYLEPWRRFWSEADLLELVELTRPLGVLCRAMTWAAAVSVLSGAEREEYADALPGWLSELLDLEASLAR